MSANRIAWLLCSNRWNSAITEYALSTARALESQGWKVYYSALKGSPGEKRATRYQLDGHSYQNFGLGEVFKLRREAKSIRPAILLLFGGPETFLARFLPGIPKIRFRGQDSDMRDELPRFKLRLSLSHCASILTPALCLQQRFAAVLPQPVYAISLGIDTQVFNWNLEAWRSQRRPTLRIVARLDPIKGHGRLFALYHEMLKLWPAERERPILHILGEAANISVDHLRSLAQRQELLEGQDYCIEAKRAENIQELMSSTDLGLIPSLGSEVICRVGEEFLLCGCPILVSGVGSLEECLSEENFGSSYRQVPEQHIAQQMADRLWSAFLESEETRRQRAEDAQKLFSLEVMGQKLQRLIHEILDSQAKRLGNP